MSMSLVVRPPPCRMTATPPTTGAFDASVTRRANATICSAPGGRPCDWGWPLADWLDFFAMCLSARADRHRGRRRLLLRRRGFLLAVGAGGGLDERGVDGDEVDAGGFA